MRYNGEYLLLKTSQEWGLDKPDAWLTPKHYAKVYIYQYEHITKEKANLDEIVDNSPPKFINQEMMDNGMIYLYNRKDIKAISALINMKVESDLYYAE